MYYSKIKHFDPANGPGIRLSLFVSGCQFHCYNCFNPETWEYSWGKEYTHITKEEILKDLSSQYYEGLSILGGDPLWQTPADIERYLIPLVQESKLLGKTVWIWSGFTWEEIFMPQNVFLEHFKEFPYITKRQEYMIPYQRELIALCDVWVDGRYEDSQRNITLPYCGSNNQRVIDVPKTLRTITETNPTGEVILYEHY